MKSNLFRTLAVLCALTLSSIGCREPAEQQGLRLLEEGQFQAAIDLLQPAVEGEPTNAELNTLYGAALLRNGQASLAVWPLRRAYKESGIKGPAGRLLVEALVNGGAVRDGITIANELLALDPDSHKLLSLRAGAHAANLDREAALADIDALIEAAPASPRALETRANLLTELDRLDEAAEAIRELRVLLESQEMPLEAMARFCGAEGEFLRKHGEIDEARAKFESCIVDYPGEPDIVTPFMQFYDAVEEHEQGLEMVILQAATPEGSRKLRLQGYLSQLLNAAGRHDEAEATLLAFAEEYPVPQPWLEIADHHASLGQMEETAAALEKAIKIQGGLAPGEAGFAYLMLSEDTRFAYADILIQLENFDRVREILRHIEEPAHKLLIEARLQLAEGDPQGALDTYHEAFRLWPSNPGSRYLAGVAALRLGEFAEASEMFQESMRSDPVATDAGLILQRMRFLSGQATGAMETGGYYYRFNPGSLETARMMLLSAGSIGLESATTGIRDEMIKTGHVGYAVADYATTLRIMEGSEAALAYLDSIEALAEPDHAPALSAWTDLMLEAGQAEAALARVEAASAQSPDSPDLLLVKARVLAQAQEDPTAAEAAYAKALELSPETASTWAAWGRHLASKGNTPEAVEAFDEARKLEPESTEYGFLAGQILFDAEDFESAEARLGSHLKDHPWHGESAMRLALIALGRQDAGPETLILARTGAEYAKSSRAQALETLARVRLARDEVEEARMALVRSVRSTNPSPGSLFLLARILSERGNVAESLQLLDQSINSGSFAEIEEARTLRTQLRTQQEDGNS